MYRPFNSLMHAALLLPAWFLPSANAMETCPLLGDGESCPAGCFLTATEIQFPVGNSARQCVSVGFGYFSPDNSNLRRKCPMGTFSDTEIAHVCEDCEAGSFASAEGQWECHLCPAGSFADSSRSTVCTPCNNEYYSGQGASSVEVWNGEVYCIDPNPPPPTEAPTVTPTSNPTNVPTPFPTSAPSVEPTGSPSVSLAPTDVDQDDSKDDGNANSTDDDHVNDPVVSQEDHAFELDENLMCNSQQDTFQWHGQCRQCPSNVEQGLFAAATLLFLAAVLYVLECMVPLCSTGIVWVGIEYLQLLYLLSYLNISWPPVASFVIGKILPMLALDFSANTNLQCLFGVSKQWDQLIMIFWPFALWIPAMVVAVLFNKGSLKSILWHRWPMVSLNIGLMASMQSSKDALEFSSLWGTTVSGLPTTSLFAGVAGIVGLCTYIAYTVCFWFGLCRFQETQSTDNSKQEPSDDQDIESLSSKGADDSSIGFWFLSMGLFPAVPAHARYWPIFWIVRSLSFLVLFHFIPKSTAILLMSLCAIVFLSFLSQVFVEPFPNQCEKKFGSKWFNTKASDTFLHACFVAMAGVSWLALHSEVSSPQAMATDVLTVFVMSASMMYWISAIAIASKLTCEDCVPFRTRATQVYGDMGTPSIDGSGEDEATDDTPPDSTGQMNRMVEIDLSGSTPPNPPIPPYSSTNLNMHRSQPKEYVFEGSSDSPTQKQLKATQANALALEFMRRTNKNRASIPHDNSNHDEEDMQTQVEEVYIDAGTGRRVDPNQNWVYSETGRPITKR